MLTERPLISVIIPVYNGAHYLAAAIESALAQTYRPLQIIVIDDGSTDESHQIAQQFTPVVQMINQSNQGVGAARNRGVAAADGEFLAFLDADDLWTPEKLTMQLQAFARPAAADMVFGQVELFYSLDQAADYELASGESGAIVNGLYAGALLIRRATFERVGPFATHWQIGEFIDWYARATELGLKSTVLSQVVVKRRRHAHNLTLRTRHQQVNYAQVLKAALDRRRQRAVAGER
ncbi:glycosyltransferase family A protein [soil metagenome]